MKSLIPIISKPENSEYFEILIQPEYLKSQYGYDGTCQVFKTSIYVEPSDEWLISLSERSGFVSLLSSSEVSITQPAFIDLIEQLGHPITIAPWQKLRLERNKARGACITYVLDDSLTKR